ncbi:hypothetical protein Nepgr_025501 [Nepenthes gracilis]|uniref:Uncharacterized protein n=1 Tax=Nepenthes gracilis TaxID=150966 RepID=A0AAD3T517_NEPGR|nr:hypothetical protein Nepgr_025501 [Nepenthes gracilis]
MAVASLWSGKLDSDDNQFDALGLEYFAIVSTANLDFCSSHSNRLNPRGGHWIGFVASEEPPAPFAEAPREPKIVGVVDVPEAGGPIGLVGELAQVRAEVLTAEANLSKERVPSLSTELTQILEEPLICLAGMGKDTEATGIVEASRPETPVSNPVASSFHPSPGGNRPERESTLVSDQWLLRPIKV